jgi:hypothetical protein
MDNTRTYEQPVVVDHGTIAELTQAIDFDGVEDGGNKNLVHHEFSGVAMP